MPSRKRRNKRQTDDESEDQPEDQPEVVDLPEAAYEYEYPEGEEDVLPLAAEQTAQVKQYEFLQKIYDKSRASWDPRLKDEETDSFRDEIGDESHAEDAELNFEDQLKTLMYRNFGEKIVALDLLHYVDRNKTSTELVRIQNGESGVYKDDNGFYVAYDKEAAQKYFGADIDLSQKRVQMDYALLQKLRKGENVKWDYPKVFRINLEKPGEMPQNLITDNEMAVHKRMQEGWTVTAAKEFDLSGLSSHDEIRSKEDVNKEEQIQNKITDILEAEGYHESPPLYAKAQPESHALLRPDKDYYYSSLEKSRAGLEILQLEEAYKSLYKKMKEQFKSTSTFPGNVRQQIKDLVAARHKYVEEDIKHNEESSNALKDVKKCLRGTIESIRNVLSRSRGGEGTFP